MPTTALARLAAVERAFDGPLPRATRAWVRLGDRVGPSTHDAWRHAERARLIAALSRRAAAGHALAEGASLLRGALALTRALHQGSSAPL